jgi:hypothetical protein
MLHTTPTKSSACLSPDCLRTECGARLSYDYLPAKSHSQHRLHCVAEYIMFLCLFGFRHEREFYICWVLPIISLCWALATFSFLSLFFLGWSFLHHGYKSARCVLCEWVSDLLAAVMNVARGGRFLRSDVLVAIYYGAQQDEDKRVG